MAKVVHVNNSKCVVYEVRNIGFLKAVKDIASSEGEGLESLAEETTSDAIKKVPSGYIASDVKAQVVNNGKDVFVTVYAEKL
jgi:hypothetical protein